MDPTLTSVTLVVGDAPAARAQPPEEADELAGLAGAVPGAVAGVVGTTGEDVVGEPGMDDVAETVTGAVVRVAAGVAVPVVPFVGRAVGVAPGAVTTTRWCPQGHQPRPGLLLASAGLTITARTEAVTAPTATTTARRRLRDRDR